MSTLISARKFVLAASTWLALLACGTSSDHETVGSSAAALSGYGVTTIPAGARTGMQEPSAAYISPRTLIVGFNVNTADGQGWAVFTDTGTGLTLTRRSVDLSFCMRMPKPAGDLLDRRRSAQSTDSA